MAENIRVTSGLVRRMHVSCCPLPGEVLLIVRDLDDPDRWVQVALTAEYLERLTGRVKALNSHSGPLEDFECDDDQQTPLHDPNRKK